MLKYVDSKFENHPHAYVSMEARMACGMGACYACVVHVKGESDAKNLRVCEEGPVFPTGKSSSRRLPCQRLNQKIV